MQLSILLNIKLLFIKPKAYFVFVINNQNITQVKGANHGRFMKDCQDIVNENSINKGIIYAVKRPEGQIQIKTSGEISSSIAQRFRNVWSFYI